MFQKNKSLLFAFLLGLAYVCIVVTQVRILPPRHKQSADFQTLAMSFSWLVREIGRKSGVAVMNLNSLNSTISFNPQKDYLPSHFPKLYHYDYDMTKRWEIVYYIFDLKEKKPIKKRFKDFNDIKDKAERLAEATKIMEAIKEMMLLGAVLGAETLMDVVVKAVEYKKDRNEVKPRTYAEYKKKINTLKYFLEDTEQEILIVEVDKAFCKQFLDWLSKKRSLSGKTLNDYKGWLSMVFNYAIENDYISENPTKGIKKVKEIRVKEHRPYSALQRAEIKKLIWKLHQDTKDLKKKPNYLGLFYFIQMIYYTLSRPNELRHLKIGSISNTHIYISSESAKDGTLRAIPINQHLEELLTAMGLRPTDEEGKKSILARQNDYVFGGMKQVGINHFSELHAKVLERLGWSSMGFTLYSYKHTAADDLISAGVSEDEIMQLMGHESIHVTRKYTSKRKINPKPLFMEKAVEF